VAAAAQALDWETSVLHKVKTLANTLGERSVRGGAPLVAAAAVTPPAPRAAVAAAPYDVALETWWQVEYRGQDAAAAAAAAAALPGYSAGHAPFQPPLVPDPERCAALCTPTDER
jgi:hypothetical protein